MKNRDHQIFYTALAFLSVATKESKAENPPSAQEVNKLATLVEEFCTANIPSQPEGVTDESDATKIDDAINKHILDCNKD